MVHRSWLPKYPPGASGASKGHEKRVSAGYESQSRAAIDSGISVGFRCLTWLPPEGAEEHSPPGNAAASLYS